MSSEKTMKLSGTEFKLSNTDLNDEAEKYMKENKCSFEDALTAVSKKFAAEGKAQTMAELDD